MKSIVSYSPFNEIMTDAKIDLGEDRYLVLTVKEETVDEEVVKTLSVKYDDSISEVELMDMSKSDISNFIKLLTHISKEVTSQ